ncbi:MAG: dienelactone hydrolase family protein [Acidobacteriota bacterium]|nr:dienelactone hydrolase family protein [Blastocatellia bacterium]MDW8239367.1 dienelactone hydrolase family protein [Acidobacteriota bacterium]
MSGEMIEFQVNGGTCPGYLSIPASGQGPGVIVIQEWWGLVPHIKEVADRLAGEGFVALAPDLYHGQATTSPDEAGKLMMALRIDEVEKELRGAVQYLIDHPATTGDKVGSIGFCMGGQLSLYAACKNPQIAACVNFYGIHPNVHPPLEELQGAFLGLFAERDAFVPVSAARELEDKLKALGKTAEVHIYPGLEHAFFNDSRPEVYNKEAAEDAWRRVLAFYRQHLSK